jgi:hypothetical protein
VALDLGETLVAFGFPGGIPLKVCASVVVRDPRPSELDYFITDLDAFEGDSGGPVLRADGSVAGIVSGGKHDYLDTEHGCREVAFEPALAADERATYAFQALAGLCVEADPGKRCALS